MSQKSFSKLNVPTKKFALALTDTSTDSSEIRKKCCNDGDVIGSMNKASINKLEDLEIADVEDLGYGRKKCRRGRFWNDWYATEDAYNATCDAIIDLEISQSIRELFVDGKHNDNVLPFPGR
ncbi:MAG: hypothetical protein OEX07_12185 [Gammaproteobacteria bacterium]|nr:hypothetical protein [Gammaproteobacteria bacterium]